MAFSSYAEKISFCATRRVAIGSMVEIAAQ